MFEEYKGGYEEEVLRLYPLEPSALICKRADAVNFNTAEQKDESDIFPTRYLPAKTIGFHVERYSAGERGGTHRHSCEALIHILTGQGHTTIEGQRLDWEVGDTLFIPPMSWHTHEAVTEASFLAVWNAPLLERLGLYYNEEVADPDLPGTDHSRRTTLYPEE